MSNYITHTQIKFIRLINEDEVDHNDSWCIDGSDGVGGFTEECETYPTAAAAMTAIPAFCARLGLIWPMPVMKIRE